MSEKVIKLIVLGDASVGKTATIIRYTDNTFLDNTIGTVGIDFKWKFIKWQNENVKLQVWDTAGQEQFRSISVQFIRRAQGIVLFYAVNSTDSFNHLHDWIESIKAHSEFNTPIIIVGNKTDLDWAVNKEEAESYAAKNNLKIFFTSAKSGENINEAFDTIAKLVLEQQQETNESVVIPIKDEGKKKEGGCC